MRKLYLNLILGAITAASLISFTSCKKTEGGGQQTTGDYVLAIRSEGDAEVSSDYLVTTDSLMDGKISIRGNGIEQSGYHFYQQTGKYLTTITYTDANVATVYKMNDSKELVEHIKFSIEQLHLMHPISETEFITMNIPRGGSENATFYVVNAETGVTIKEKATSVYTPTNGSGEQAYFSGMTLRDDKLYVSFFQILDNTFASTQTDSAYVAIYSWPELEYQKTITDPRTGPAGAYAAEGHVFTTETNDIYTMSPCAIAAGAPQETRPSGILRINNGEEEFDDSYFFNIEEATGGYKLCNASYLGNNKVLASIFSFKEHTADDLWSRRDVKLAIIDVVAQTVNYIDGIPVHYGGPTGAFPNQYIEDNGKVYIKITTDSGINIYEVDPNTYTAKKGAEIDGAAVYGFFNL